MTTDEKFFFAICGIFVVIGVIGLVKSLNYDDPVANRFKMKGENKAEKQDRLMRNKYKR